MRSDQLEIFFGTIAGIALLMALQILDGSTLFWSLIAISVITFLIAVHFSKK